MIARRVGSSHGPSHSGKPEGVRPSKALKNSVKATAAATSGVIRPSDPAYRARPLDDRVTRDHYGSRATSKAAGRVFHPKQHT